MENRITTVSENSDVQFYSQENIQQKIYNIRGLQIMLDRDLANIYNVETKVLNQAVKRNIKRFPNHFMFQLSESEWNDWKSQFVTSNFMSEQEIQSIKIGIRRPPYAFTEQGVSQLSSVLKSDYAIEISIKIIDAFVAMRRYITANAGIFQRLEAVELKQIATDEKINNILSRLDDGSLKQKLDETIYHFGASLKDLGKRWFSVDIITEHSADELLSRLV